jgi:mono/diheme cytochrome c family protein/rhodanese-related sulfurtransferase
LAAVAGCGGAAPSPLEPTPTSTSTANAEGAALYAQYCALCHGESGEGYAADNATRLRGQSFLRTASDDLLALAIARGRVGTAMGGYSQELGGPLTEAQMEALVATLRAWQTEPSLALDDTPTEGDMDRGAIVFGERCGSCHGALAEGETAQSLNRTTFLAEASDAYLRYAIVNGREQTPMPAFGDSLTTTQIDDIVAFLRNFEEDPHAVPAHMMPPSLDRMAILRHPDGPTPSFTLREERFVSAAQVRAAVDAGSRLILLDARPTSDWLIRRLPGALPVPYYEVEPILARLPRDGTWIVAYCGCPHAASGHVVDALREAGVPNAAVLDEGVYHWIEQGFPTETGPVDPSPAP